MDVKYNDNILTIKTIEIDGKKMTKQLIQQIELERYTFLDVVGKEYKLYEIDVLIKSELEKLKLTCEIIGWINLHFEKDDYVVNWVGLHNKSDKHHVRTILFVNQKGELRRGYIARSIFKLFCKEVPQLFI